MKKEKREQITRYCATGTSLVETIIGIILIIIPDPATTTLGVAMVLHGGTNTVAGASSTIAYEVTDGDVELSTSVAGLITQGATYVIANEVLGDNEAAKQVSALSGSVVDCIDSITAAAMMPNPVGAMKVVTQLNTAINLAGDAVLLYEGIEDAGLLK